MKKIMFSDRYGLTQAVLDGKKTMTRRIINGDYEDMKAYHANGGWHFIADTKDGDSVEVKPAYEVCETIAIAQNYKDCIGQEYLDYVAEDEVCKLVMNGHIGCTNKMFVRADLMPHRIRIKNIKVERLQDISDVARIIREEAKKLGTGRPLSVHLCKGADQMTNAELYDNGKWNYKPTGLVDLLWNMQRNPQLFKE